MKKTFKVNGKECVIRVTDDNGNDSRFTDRLVGDQIRSQLPNGGYFIDGSIDGTTVTKRGNAYGSNLKEDLVITATDLYAMAMGVATQDLNASDVQQFLSSNEFI